MSSITVLGSTGSIGVQTLDVIARHPERFSVFALTAYRHVERLFQQCCDFKPAYAVMVDEVAAKQLSNQIKAAGLKTVVLSGSHVLEQVAADDHCDVVMAAIVGAAGLSATMSAVIAGKRVLLANKEALVMAGVLMTEAAQASGAEILPVDSEHNAIFQCLPADYRPGVGSLPDGVASVVLTASGGPFLNTPLSEFESITPSQAVAHPNWSMGAKVSIDSATMMNKGLEVIEAQALFGLAPEHIEVLVHPQSIVHAMVRYTDGSVLAQFAPHDMRVPIAHALSWPERVESGVDALDFTAVGPLEFQAPCPDRFPCLSLAYEALQAGVWAVITLNAANEWAVQRFIEGQISFPSIPALVQQTLEKMTPVSVHDLEGVLQMDLAARRLAGQLSASFALGI